MTIKKLLTEMSQKDISFDPNKKFNAKEILDTYVKNYENNNNKKFSMSAATSAIGVFKKKFDSEPIKIEKMTKEIHKLTNVFKTAGGSTQPRVPIGASFQDTLIGLTNAIKQETSVSPLTLNGEKLTSIINNLTLFNCDLENSTIEINLNKKSDLFVKENQWEWKESEALVSDASGNNAVVASGGIYLELKTSNAESPTIKGTMLFELGKVSTYKKAYAILKKLNVLVLTEAEEVILKTKRNNSNSAQRTIIEQKVIDGLTSIMKEQKEVNDFMKEVILLETLNDTINKQLQSYTNNFIVIGNTPLAKNNKVSIIGKMSNYKISLSVSTWRGFGRIIGKLKQLNEEETEKKPKQLNEEDFYFEFNFEGTMELTEKEVRHNSRIRSSTKNGMTNSSVNSSVDNYLGDLLKEITLSTDTPDVLTKVIKQPFNNLFGNKKKKKKRGSKCSK